jgi:hypothetical protein
MSGQLTVPMMWQLCSIWNALWRRQKPIFGAIACNQSLTLSAAIAGSVIMRSTLPAPRDANAAS